MKYQLNLHNTELEKLIQDNYGLIVSQATFFRPKNKQLLEDCIQIGVMTFIKVVDKFDSKKAKFSTYISSCIRNAICDYLKTQNKYKYQLPLLQEVACTQAEQFWELIPDNLTQEEKSVIMLKLENYDKSDIALMLDCSQKEVIRIFNSAKTKIKAANDDN